MASCKRAGTTWDGGSRAASACSMRSRQDSSCASKLLLLADSSCLRMRRSAASFTRSNRRRAPGSCTLPAHALDLTQRDRGNRGTISGADGVFDGQVGRHRAGDARPAHPDLQGLERMAERIVDRRALESAMRHAVVAARILADAVSFPFGVIDQRPVARRIPLIGEQIARSLPTEQVVGGIAPRRALIGLVAGEKIQEQSGMIERPGNARGAAAAAENTAKQLLAGIAAEEYVL